MKKDKKIRTTIFIMLTIILGLFIVKVCPVLLQNDTLYDIKLGERYLTRGMFHIDDYSFHSNLIYQTHHYLVTIIDYIVYNLFSFKGLYLLEIFLTSLITFIFYRLNKEMIKNKFLIYMSLFFYLIALSPFISLRAQMYSYIIFLLEILFIEKYLNGKNKKYLILLTILPVLLINFHSGVIYFYFIIMGTYLFSALPIRFKRIFRDKRLGKSQTKALITTSFIGAVLTLINPYGISGITYGLKTIGSYYISSYISEFQPFNLLTPMGILTSLFIAVCVISIIFSKKKIKIHELLLLFGTILMSILSTRHFSLLVITSIVILPHIEDAYEQLNSKWDIVESFKRGVNTMNIIIVLMYSVTFIYLGSFILSRDNNSLPNNKYPVDALEYIKKNLPNARIFNQYEWGSYMIFSDIKTYIDPRCDLFNQQYNKDTRVMKDYIDTITNNKNYSLIVSKYNIEYFLLNRNEELSKKIIKDNKYKVVYTDDISVVIKVIK